MANQNTSKTVLQYVVDKATLNQTLKANDQVEHSLLGLDDTVKDVSNSVERMGKSIKKSAKESLSDIDRLNDAFDETSKKVALAGDVESNLRALGGAAGAAGLGGVGAGIGTVAEVPALIEALPRLKEAISGLPETAKNAAQSIGVAGAVGGGALIGAMVAMTLAIGELQKRAAEAAAEINQQAAIEDELIQLEIAGNKEVAQARLEAARQELQIEQARQADRQAVLEREQEELDKAMGGITGIIFDAIVTGLLGPIAGLFGRAVDLKGALVEVGSEMGLLEGDFQAAKQNAAEAGGEVDRLTDLIAGLEEGIQSGRFEEGAGALETTTQTLQESTDSYTQSVQRTATAQRNAADQITQINNDLSRSIADARRDTARELDDLEREYGQEAVSLLEDQFRAIGDLRTEQLREEQRSARDAVREMRDIRKTALRDEADAIRNRDVLALAEIARRTKDEVDDTKTRLTDERQERMIAFEQKLSDLREEQKIERLEALRDVQLKRQELLREQQREIQDLRTAASRKLQDAKSAADREIQLARQAAQQVTQINQQMYQSIIQQARQAASAASRGSGLSAGGSLGAASLTQSRANSTLRTLQFLGLSS